MSEREQRNTEAGSESASTSAKDAQLKLSLKEVLVQIAAGVIGAGVLTWLLTFSYLTLRLGSASCEIYIDNLAGSPIHICREAITGWPEVLFGNLGPALGAALGVWLFGMLSKKRGSFILAFVLSLLAFAGTQLFTGQSVIYPRALMLDAVNIELNLHVARASLIAALAAYLGYLVPLPKRKSRHAVDV